MDTRAWGVAAQLSRDPGLFPGEAKVGSGSPSECGAQDTPARRTTRRRAWVFKRTDLDLPRVRERIKARSLD